MIERSWSEFDPGCWRDFLEVIWFLNGHNEGWRCKIPYSTWPTEPGGWGMRRETCWSETSTDAWSLMIHDMLRWFWWRHLDPFRYLWTESCDTSVIHHPMSPITRMLTALGDNQSPPNLESTVEQENPVAVHVRWEKGLWSDLLISCVVLVPSHSTVQYILIYLNKLKPRTLCWGVIAYIWSNLRVKA